MKWVTTLPLLSKWIRKRSAHSCMCGTAAEIWGTFFFPVGINWFPSTSQDLETLKKLFLRRTGALPDYTFQLTEKQQAVMQDRSAVTRECWNISPKELSFKAAATHVTNKHVSGLWTLTVTFKAVRHFHHSASPQSTNYRYVIPAFKRTVCSDRHNALFWCWRNEMPPSSKL